ncbi:MAG: alpha/beta hydrolase [Anaerolineae bacterium]|nr:alpha/beta hydrolase [Anaerolineae bacterium]
MFITVDNAQIYTVIFGSSSRTLMALGGWAGSWELWTNPFTYLSQSWRTAAYDHRGTGATVALTESITLQRMVDDVFVVLDALNIEQCVLAAESAGTLVALMAALQRPERFNGLVLVDGLYYRPAPDGVDPFLTGLKQNYEGTIRQFVDNCVPPATNEAVRRWGRQILMRSPQAAAIQLYECVFGVDLRPQLAHILLPTLIIHGEDDQIVPLAASQWLATQIPNAHLHIVKDAGHVPSVTHPEAVAEAINQYFAAVE